MFNIVKSQISTLKQKKISLHIGGIKWGMAAAEMLLILKRNINVLEMLKKKHILFFSIIIE